MSSRRSQSADRSYTYAEASLKEIRQEHDTLRQQNDHLAYIISHSAGLRAENELLERKLAQKTTSHLINIDQAFSYQNQQLLAYKAQNAEQKRQIEENTNKRNHLQKKKDAKKSELSELERELEVLQRELTRKTEFSTKVASQRIGLEEESAYYDNYLDYLNQHFENIKLINSVTNKDGAMEEGSIRRIETLTRQELLEAYANKFKEEYNEMVGTADRKEKRILERSLSQAQAEHNEYERKVGKLRLQLAKKQAEKGDNEAEIARLTKVYKGLEAHKEKIRREYLAKKMRLEAELEQQKIEEKRLVEEIDGIMRFNNAAIDEITRLQYEIAQYGNLLRTGQETTFEYTQEVTHVATSYAGGESRYFASGASGNRTNLTVTDNRLPSSDFSGSEAQ